MSDTPRTDEMCERNGLCCKCAEMPKDFARQLERENQQLNADKQRLMLDNASWESTCDRLTAERQQLREAISNYMALIEPHHHLISGKPCGRCIALERLSATLSPQPNHDKILPIQYDNCKSR